MLDRLPAWVRHYLLLLLGAAFTMSPGLRSHVIHIHDALKALGGATGFQVLLASTPLTRQYGLGKKFKELSDAVSTIENAGVIPPASPS